jgi:DNA-directed RNA polymerase III subunit RPC2
MILRMLKIIILNKAAIDCGFGRCMVFKKHQASVRR